MKAVKQVLVTLSQEEMAIAITEYIHKTNSKITNYRIEPLTGLTGRAYILTQIVSKK